MACVSCMLIDADPRVQMEVRGLILANVRHSHFPQPMTKLWGLNCCRISLLNLLAWSVWQPRYFFVVLLVVSVGLLNLVTACFVETWANTYFFHILPPICITFIETWPSMNARVLCWHSNDTSFCSRFPPFDLQDGDAIEIMGLGRLESIK